MSETTKKDRKYKVGYYSMGISTVLAGVLLVLSQLGYVVIEDVFILWPVMLILLGLETIVSKLVAAVSKTKQELSPAWGIIVICTMLIACSQIWMMLIDSAYYIW